MKTQLEESICSGRAAKLKERLLDSPYEIDIERARHYTNAWRGLERSAPCRRRPGA